jgi:MFS family permease
MRTPNTAHDSQGNRMTGGWPRPGALVLAGGIIMGVALGVRHVQGLFLLPVTIEHGWSRELFAIAIAAQNLVWGLSQPLAGMAADLVGARKVLVGGVLLYAAGVLGMAWADGPVLFILSAGLLAGVGQAGTTFGVVYPALSRLASPERQGWVLGAAGAVGGLGQFVLVPLAQQLISRLGWHGALLLLGTLIAASLPLTAWLDDRASGTAAAQASPRGVAPLLAAVREAFGHQGFWLLTLGFFACGFQLAFIGNHLPAYLLDRGLSPQAGAAALATVAAANVAGIYYCGLLGSRLRRKYLLAGIYVLRSVAMALFVLLPASTWGAILFAAAMGFLWLGTVPLTNGVLGQVFGVHYLSTLFGFVFLSHQLGSFLGVWLGGRVFDATGSYEPIWLAAIGLGLVAAALHWPINDRQLIRPAAARLPA